MQLNWGIAVFICLALGFLALGCLRICPGFGELRYLVGIPILPRKFAMVPLPVLKNIVALDGLFSRSTHLLAWGLHKRNIYNLASPRDRSQVA